MSSANKYTLKPSLSEKFKGIIWKIETDEKQTVVAIETRDVENHTATFSAFDFRTGECFFREISVEDSWNWGIDRVTGGLVFLHGYLMEKSPEHKGIIALNRKGEAQWQHFNKTLYTVSEEGLIAYNPSIQPRFHELLSPLNGSVQQYPVKDYKPVSRDIIIPDITDDIPLNRHLLPQNISGPVLYSMFNKKKFFSFHVKTGEGYTQKLLVYKGDTLILDEILALNIQKFNPEAFFIQHNHLFCICDNKQKFVSYLV